MQKLIEREGEREIKVVNNIQSSNPNFFCQRCDDDKFAENQSAQVKTDVLNLTLKKERKLKAKKNVIKEKGNYSELSPNVLQNKTKVALFFRT